MGSKVMTAKVYVIIPCYKVVKHIADVVQSIGSEVDRIIVVDDCCPDGSGDFVIQKMDDPRVIVLKHDHNKGVGGAVMTGYKYALFDGADICVKIDGDGQMDPTLIPSIIRPIVAGQADYVKGNRFCSLYDVSTMPKLRLFGNTMLSFMTKISSGYWSVFDPTNGFTAIHRCALQRLSLDQIDERYFFETNMLIALGGLRARVLDMPMQAVYGDEVSGLKIKDILGNFAKKQLKAIARRLVYQYYLRDFSLASIHLPVGLVLLLFGFSVGVSAWMESLQTGVVATSGTVILSALPVLLGVQFILSFFSFDIGSEPSVSLQSFGFSEKKGE